MQPVPPPEQGQLVRVRHRHFLVQDIHAGNVESGEPPVHRVRLEALDDDLLGETLDVIWEHEVHREVHDAIGLPDPRQGWDPRGLFDSFLLATRWSLTSVLEGLPLQAPFRGDIQIEDYQLDPVVRALRMPRVSLLIADGVGLGKTIEAGLVMQELIARQRVRRVMILCPASLQQQWLDEMRTKFSLRFEVVDRDYVHRLRKEYGVHVNPWASYPRLITSMDFLKREAPLNSFRASLKSNRGGVLKDWDLLIVDEAHNLAPSGRKTFVRDSDRTIMIREIKDSFEHRLFLTATPHNGFTESFTALLEMLDPIRFSRGPNLDRAQLDTVMVRRLKDGIHDAMGRRVFPRREVVSCPVTMDVGEAALHDLLTTYTSKRLDRSGNKDRFAVRFALVMLKRRLLSSPLAFAESIAVHQSHLRGLDDPDAATEKVVAGLRSQVEEDHDDDDEKDQTERTAMMETARFFESTDEEVRLVEQMRELAERQRELPDAKARYLLDFIRLKLNPEQGWNRDRLLVFTEFKDTMLYLERLLEAQGWGDRVLTLYGGMPSRKATDDVVPQGREAIKAAFRSDPDSAEGKVRILVATDAAAEGLNLQEHCRLLIHWDIPWNPNRMEQRNGRIDRHGQPAEEVFCHHFVFAGREDSEFLQTVVNKVQVMRDDLRAVGEVIAAQVEEAMLGQRMTLDVPESSIGRVRADLRAEVVHKQKIRELQRAWKDAKRELGLTRDNLERVVAAALAVQGQGKVQSALSADAKNAFRITELPQAWTDARAALKDGQGRTLGAVFDEADARGRKDVALVHLDHPLMKRCLAVFRANLWATGLHESHQLHRTSYRVLADADCDRPVVIAFARLVCVSTAGHKLHEDLFMVGGEIHDSDIFWLKDQELDGLLGRDAEHPAISTQVGDYFRQRFSVHAERLRQQIEEAGAKRGAQVKKDLRAKGTADAGEVRKLIDQRIKEITKTLQQMDKEATTPQLQLWPAEQLEQHRSTRDYLDGRLKQLQEERTTQPEAVKQRYKMRTPRAFPLALLYLIPESMLEARGK